MSADLSSRALMTVTLNEAPVELPGGSKLVDLLERYELLGKKGIAVAVNAEVQNRSTWADRTLSENDQILVITATQGG